MRYKLCVPVCAANSFHAYSIPMHIKYMYTYHTCIHICSTIEISYVFTYLHISVFLSIFSNEDCNCIINSNNSCSSTSGSCDNTVLIQTELSELDLDQNLIIEKSPGENVQVHLGVLDERRNQTIAFLKIDIDDDANDNDTEDVCKTLYVC